MLDVTAGHGRFSDYAAFFGNFYSIHPNSFFCVGEHKNALNLRQHCKYLHLK